MDYVTVRELREKSGEIWDRIEAGEEFVVTRNGKPIALLVHTAPNEVEDRIRALRAAQFGNVIRLIQEDAVRTGANLLTEQDIQAEIDAVRRERRLREQGGDATRLVAAEPPATRRHARRR